MMSGNCEYYAPKTIEETLVLLEQFREKGKLLAGGTDLVPKITAREVEVSAVIYIAETGGLDFIEERDGRIAIGPTVTFSRIASSPLLRGKARALVEAAAEVGSPAIRNMGTIGGNIGTASPAGDGIVALLALEAEVRLRSIGGERVVPVDQLFTAPKATVIRSDELITEIILPALPSGHRSAFVKLGKRKAMAISVVSAAVSLEVENGRCSDARIALGSVAPTPIRARDAENELKGKVIDNFVLAAVGQMAAGATTPISDTRAGAWYRREMSGVLAQRAIRKALLTA